MGVKKTLGIGLLLLMVSAGTFIGLKILRPIKQPSSMPAAEETAHVSEKAPQPLKEIEVPTSDTKAETKVVKWDESKIEPDHLLSSTKKFATALTDTTPPKLQVIEPTDRSYTLTPRVLVRVHTEEGCHVEVNQEPLSEKSAGVFEGLIQLQLGRNNLEIQANDMAGNRTKANRRVTFIDAEKLHNQKDRLLQMLEQLNEIRGVSREIDQRIEELLSQLTNMKMKDANQFNRLSQELQTIRDTRLGLEQEIEKTIKDIDTFLATIK